MLALQILLLSTHASASPPSGVEVASMSDVVWTDPIWKNDGSGAMPIGNGDITSSVWVDDTTGDLRLLLSKSDVFDENSQPVKTGVLRLHFDPPLWAASPPPAPTPAPSCPTSGGPLSAFFENHSKGNKTSTIGDQQHLLTFDAKSWAGCSNSTNCAAEIAKLCCRTSSCVAFSWNAAVHNFVELFASTVVNRDGTPGPGWRTWTMIAAPPPPPPPPPAPAPGSSAKCPVGGKFCQTLHLANATVTIKTPALDVSVSVDLNPALRGGVPHRDAGFLRVKASGAKFSLKVTLEPYRKSGAKTTLGRGFCYPRYDQADTIVAGAKDSLVPSADAITWYHWNHLNTSYYSQTLANQGVTSPVGSSSGLIDMFTHRAWGGSVSAPGMLQRPTTTTAGVGGDPSSAAAASATSLSLEGSGLSAVDVQVTLLTLEPAEAPTEKSWLAALATVKPSPATPQPTHPLACLNKQPDQSDCSTTWGEIMERSYVEVTAASNTSAAAAEAKQITDHVNWDRYLSLVQGRVAFGPIKFNGQDFNCNDTGKGWDTRGWGADYWWQNERQPYYNVLAQGDFDTMRSFLGFYRRMLPYVQARTAAQFKGTPTELKHPAALYEETCTQFGTYNEGDWGCHSPVPRQYGASANGFIRFHWTGALELSLMVLDQFDVSGDLDDLKQNLPMAVGVVEAYRQRFPNKDKNGKTDFFPAQALETYQCGDPSGKSRANCPSNPSTDIGGLKSVLPKLIALPSSVTTAQQVATWKKQLADLPPLPQGPAAKKKYNQNKIYPIATGNGFPTTGKGQRHNSENTEMYVAHPFRLFGVGKTKMPDGAAPSDITLAQQAYAERHSPCNDGWCQDIIQAAMLNMTDEAALQLAGRAAAPPAKGFRFRGFAAHYQDYEPSLDHFGFMRTGLDYMLMAPMDDEQRRILLFPTWPVKRWNVRFKMHAARNTTIEASCQDGQLEYLIVTPPARKADVVVLNCEQQ